MGLLGLCDRRESGGGGAAGGLLAEIDGLRRDRRALILAHYYQEPAVQDLADAVGDSLHLAQAAQRAEAEVILFCGVRFMAETAKILNPGARVLLPDADAGCSLVDECGAGAFGEWLADYGDALVVSYVNSSAAVKAMSDIICTSANAVRVVESLPKGRRVVFAPDRNLGRWVEAQTGRGMILYPGSCEVHVGFGLDAVEPLMAERPGAKLVAHPECDPAVVSRADFVGSTAAMLDYVAADGARQFVVATEEGIVHQMAKRRPDAEFAPVPLKDGCAPRCRHMKLNTLEKIRAALEGLSPEIAMDEALRQRARAPLERMLLLG
jgi:quinolinate synthase